MDHLAAQPAGCQPFALGKEHQAQPRPAQRFPNGAPLRGQPPGRRQKDAADREPPGQVREKAGMVSIVMRHDNFIDVPDPHVAKRIGQGVLPAALHRSRVQQNGLPGGQLRHDRLSRLQGRHRGE